MDIETTRTETDRTILERMTAEYGDLKGAQAALAHDPAAMDAAYWFKQFRDHPDAWTRPSRRQSCQR